LPQPKITQVAAHEMPEPERRLLVHNRDMTPTLEAAHGRTIHLRVLEHVVTDDVVRRLVALLLDGVDTPVEMGAIRIFLDRLPAQARDAVLEEREPFGAVLRRTRVTHFSRPMAYFRVTADALMRDALRTGRRALYGRRNTIWDSGEAPLAEVVEILPPTRNILEIDFE
jgi:chorismate-pyruvate lyase